MIWSEWGYFCVHLNHRNNTKEGTFYILGPTNEISDFWPSEKQLWFQIQSKMNEANKEYDLLEKCYHSCPSLAYFLGPTQHGSKDRMRSPVNWSKSDHWISEKKFDFQNDHIEIGKVKDFAVLEMLEWTRSCPTSIFFWDLTPG